MNQMENVTPIHEWVDKLQPGDLIRVSYGSGSHYMGAFKDRKLKTNVAILYYYDMPGPMVKDSNKDCWYTERLEGKCPPVSYIYGYIYKNRLHPAQEWMLTKVQKKYYNKLKQELGYEY